MIAVIDYGAGNLRSISRALHACGQDVEVTSDPNVVRGADAVVLPGVGNAGHAMASLAELGMVDTIAESVEAGKPFLGICLGMQVMFADQEEGETRGLGILPGRVRSLRAPVKIPHMGWNRSRVARSGPLGTTGDEAFYYFVHSYVVEPVDRESVAAVSTYGEEFPSIVVRDAVWGTQFHPEKSGDAGLRLIRRWVGQLDRSIERRPLAVTT